MTKIEIKYGDSVQMLLGMRDETISPGCHRQSLTVLTGFKRSTRDAYIDRLKKKGLVDLNGQTVFSTDEGKAKLPNAQPLPAGPELRSYWMGKLPEGEKRIFELLVSYYPNPVERGEISAVTGFKRSTRDAYLSRMSSKMLGWSFGISSISIFESGENGNRNDG